MYIFIFFFIEMYMVVTSPPATGSDLAPGSALRESLAKTRRSEMAILSGGCFRRMRAVFQRARGVREALSGYDGGPKDVVNCRVDAPEVTALKRPFPEPYRAQPVLVHADAANGRGK